MALERIKKELKSFKDDPPSDCWAGPTDNDMFKWTAHIMGPKSSPYETGIFLLAITFPQDYPYRRPKVKFTTKIWHHGITDKGDISLDILRENWSPSLTISKVLPSIQSILADATTNTYLDYPLVPHIAKLYEEDREFHDELAQSWVAKYADGTNGSPSLHDRLKKELWCHDAINEGLSKLFEGGDLMSTLGPIIIGYYGKKSQRAQKYAQYCCSGRPEYKGRYERREKEVRKPFCVGDGDLFVKTLWGKIITIRVQLMKEPIWSVKQKIMDKEGIPVEQMRLVWAGKLLDDSRTLYSYGACYETTVHLILRLRG